MVDFETKDKVVIEEELLEKKTGNNSHVNLKVKWNKRDAGFHLIMFFFSMYISVLFTSWRSTNYNDNNYLEYTDVTTIWFRVGPLVLGVLFATILNLLSFASKSKY
jgi:hypothetical protein